MANTLSFKCSKTIFGVEQLLVDIVNNIDDSITCQLVQNGPAGMDRELSVNIPETLSAQDIFTLGAYIGVTEQNITKQ